LFSIDLLVIEPCGDRIMQKHDSFFVQSLAAVSALTTALLLLAIGDAHARDYNSDDQHERDQRGSLVLALDFEYSSAVQSDQLKKGGGGALRIGTQRNLDMITLIPELTLDYHNFAAHTPDNAQIIAGKLGGRIRFFKIVEPGIFAHLGVGHVFGDESYSHTGLALDAGVTLDLTVIPLLDIGLHVAWNRVFGGHGSGVNYGIAGAHVALVL
jgi:hypothetical protein